MSLHLFNTKENKGYPLTLLPRLCLSDVEHGEMETLLTRLGRLWVSGKDWQSGSKRGMAVVCLGIVMLLQVNGNNCDIVVNEGEMEYKMKVRADDEALWDFLSENEPCQ